MGEWPMCERGVASSPTVVFLHGFLGSGESWEGVVSRLSDAFHCLLVDLPGHGRNLAPLGRWPSLGKWAAALEACLEEKASGAVHLVGYSLGGRLALRFALDFPHRVRSLTLESASPGLSGVRERALRRRLDRERAQMLRRDDYQAFLEAWYRQEIFGNLEEGQRQALIQAARGRDARKMAVIVESLSPGREPSLWDSLARLEMPVLLIGGGEDRVYAGILRRMAASIPNARLYLVEKAGHNVHAFFPQEVATAVREFLDGR
ncbi:MAG: 2-succinyl-6-hydroxy-2,4-cyclohexadiene-1-carboxylate synthase [Chloroflexi bacterium]|nr:2-succinyl-6-hydroxy-2,4-cyclohexadiene-1-carboxylate synthase [Chloroflexota bacterium]